MPPLENQRHERFAQELASGKSADQAYMDAGYEENRGNASRLKANENVTTRVRELQDMAAEKVAIDRAWVLERLMKNARICMGEETITIKVKKRGSTEVLEIEINDRDAREANNALELLGKTEEVGLFVERHELNGALAITDSIDRPPAETREEWLERRKREIAASKAVGTTTGTAN